MGLKKERLPTRRSLRGITTLVRRLGNSFRSFRENTGATDDATGRLQLARWLTSGSSADQSRHGERIWRGHFGAGLVRASITLANSARPRPISLFWLAAQRFINSGWSIKPTPAHHAFRARIR